MIASVCRRSAPKSAAFLAALSIAAAACADGIDTTYTYQGMLNAGSARATGWHDLRFRMYDADTGGAQVGPQITLSRFLVEGRFTAPLDFGDVFDGTALWLEIDVRVGGGTNYTTLSPRQPLTAAPFALYALNAADGASMWQENGLDVYYDQGNVGVGTDTPLAPLHVAGPIYSRGGASTGLYAYNPNNETASASLGWLNDVARIRIGGSGAGSGSGFAVQGVGDSTLLRVLSNGSLGLGDDEPQARLHVRTSDLALTSGALENDEVIVEAQDAVLGLYSTNQGDWASAIALKETSAGAVVDTWGIGRRTSAAATGASVLRFTYGPGADQADNPALMTLESDGQVGIGTTSPNARLDVETALPNEAIASFVKTGPSNTTGIYVETDDAPSTGGTVHAVNQGVGAALRAENSSTAGTTALVAQRPNSSAGTIAEFRIGNTAAAYFGAQDGDLRLPLGGSLWLYGGFVRFSDGTSQTSAANILRASVTVDPPSLNSGANTTINVTVTGAAVGDGVVVNPGADLGASYAIAFARVSASNTVSIGLINPSSSTWNPSSSTWRFRIIK